VQTIVDAISFVGRIINVWIATTLKKVKSYMIQANNTSDRNNIQPAVNATPNDAIGSTGYKYLPVRTKIHPSHPYSREIILR
jgi:hypothetical protein